MAYGIHNHVHYFTSTPAEAALHFALALALRISVCNVDLPFTCYPSIIMGGHGRRGPTRLSCGKQWPVLLQ